MVNSKRNVRVIKTNFIKDVAFLSAPTAPADLTLPPVDIDKTRKREEKALKVAEEDKSNMGVGVTYEAQTLFDFLRKTNPCRWEGKNIVVMDEVTIKPPYGANDCDGPKSAVGRVKKLLEHYKA
eukprot:GFYU01012950.1.p1 GENE.GFYU01012950.1~~GFYU01012950.1.p1  ORF type:complete len:124 (+),score=41.72 GFYU01012950.1:169-540(+)